MSKMKCTLVLFIALSAAARVGPVALAKGAAVTPAINNAPIRLVIKPKDIHCRHGQPVRLNVFLRNVSDEPVYLWFWPRPAAFGADTDMGCLMMRCWNEKTGRDVRYKWPPPGMTTQDAHMRELVDAIPAHSYDGTTINLLDWCVLPRGKYKAEFQYETNHIPKWIKPDKQAWHGMTNKVSIVIHIE